MEVANQIMVKGIVVGVFQENCWVIGSRQSGEAICIDPGDQPAEILALARDMGVRIKKIVNSHAHIDHVCGIAGVKSGTGADFYLHHQDLDLLRDGFDISASRFGLMPDQRPPMPDAFIEDGDTIEIDGVDLRVITTPGHTPGSVSYYTKGLLFSGDTLFKDSIGRTDMPGGSFEEEMNSICDKLLTLPEDTVVLPGHMAQTTIGDELKYNPFVREWRMVQKQREGSA
jgi:glyoxylase-like metal-dependent hydrolase (beta-lactamase superfamily II)